MAIAQAVGAKAGALSPRFLALSSSQERDLPFLVEDVLGSVAHALGLQRAGILDAAQAGALRAALCALLDDLQAGRAALPEEEDVHMAVEALLGQRLPELAARLHTGRSRNDQVALALRLHLREQLRRCGEWLGRVLQRLGQIAADHVDVLLPSYTHRQRAIPSTVAHWALAGAAALCRDAALCAHVLTEMDRCPLGAGAIAGSSLPLDRGFVAALLGFAEPTWNSMDTVGDRDFAQDLAYLSARVHQHLSRVAADLIDYSAAEFALVELGDGIACGSSMMPHKRNPDVFELVRGRAALAVGALCAELVLPQKLPLGYSRDLQEDRALLTGLGPQLAGTLELLDLGLSAVRFRGDRAEAMLRADYTQATDLAEVLVAAGLPFRRAYRLVGGFVAALRARGEPLLALRAEEVAAALIGEDLAVEAHAAVTQRILERLDPRACVAARRTDGGPAPEAVARQLEQVEAARAQLEVRVARVPTLGALREHMETLAL